MAYFPWLIGLSIVALIWWYAIGARTNARRAALRACAKAEVMFIDELALKKIWVGRDSRRQFCIKRRYGFEFYHSGDIRYSGRVEMSGLRVARVQLDAYPM